MCFLQGLDKLTHEMYLQQCLINSHKMTLIFLYYNTTAMAVTIAIAGLPWWFSGKESACQYRRCDPWVREIP